MKASGQHVAVIGAGAAGLVTAREALRAGLRVTLFERSDAVGGVWVYDDRSESAPLGGNHDEERLHASLYASLRTNLPRELMAFRDFAFDDADDDGNSEQAFPHHSAVRRYLERFAEHFEISPHIRFGRRVVRVHPPATPRAAWRITHGRAPQRGTAEAELRTQNFDAVAICNGHYRRTSTPQLRGLDYFRGRVLHSHNYRFPSILHDKRVVILGSGSSGVDLALEAESVAREVTLCASEHRTQFPDHPKIVRAPWPEFIDRAGKFRLPDDGTIEADVLVFCTGYRYDFPFLPDVIWKRPPSSTPPQPPTLLQPP